MRVESIDLAMLLEQGFEATHLAKAVGARSLGVIKDEFRDAAEFTIMVRKENLTNSRAEDEFEVRVKKMEH